MGIISQFKHDLYIYGMSRIWYMSEEYCGNKEVGNSGINSANLILISCLETPVHSYAFSQYYIYIYITCSRQCAISYGRPTDLVSSVTGSVISTVP